jgi:enoyl-CoA hydratase/carnithine racemase
MAEVMADVREERRGAALWLTIDREERRNALNEGVLDALRRGIEAAAADPALRAVVLTGAGDKVFCAGGDLKPDAAGDPFRTDPAQLDNPVVRLLRAMEESPLPIVARVNGHATGGGFGLVCAADFAIAAETAKLGAPEARIGVFPLMILPAMLRLIPRRKLLELCMTGDLMLAAEALACGIVGEVAPPAELDARVDALVARLSAASPTAVRFGRRALAAVADLPYGAALEYAQRLLPQLARTEDAQEGFRAFNERRTPAWTSR